MILLRYVLPGVVVLAGLVVMALGSEAELEGGAGIVSAGIAIFFINWLFRAARTASASATARMRRASTSTGTGAGRTEIRLRHLTGGPRGAFVQPSKESSEPRRGESDGELPRADAVAGRLPAAAAVPRRAVRSRRQPPRDTPRR